VRGDAGGDQAADAFVQGDGGAGEGAIRAFGDAVFQRDCFTAEFGRKPFRHAGGEDGIRHRDGVGRGGEGELKDDGIDVQAVGDEAGEQARIGKRCARHAGGAVMQRRLGVEHMGDQAGAGIGSGENLRGGGGAVADCHGDAGSHELFDDFNRAGPLGRQRDDAQSRERQQVSQRLGGKILQPV